MKIHSSLMGRRSFLTTLALAAAAPLVRGQEQLRHTTAPSAAPEVLPPIRAITGGPKFHWFGYYDKFQFDPTDRYVLGNQVDFEHRSPRPDDEIAVGMVDTQDGDKWIELGRTRAWNWQQGCMLQWVPASRSGKKVCIDSAHEGGRQSALLRGFSVHVDAVFAAGQTSR